MGERLLAGTLDVSDARQIRQYFHHHPASAKQLAVAIPGMGTQRTTYLEFAHPEPKDDVKIVGIPGICAPASDLNALMREKVIQGGRSGIIIGYPIAHNGYVTQAFAEATIRHPIETHEIFFRGALTQIAPGQKEGIAHSTGALLLGRLLTNPDIQQSTDTATLIAPAGMYPQTDDLLNGGIAYEIFYWARQPWHVPKNAIALFRKQQQYYKEVFAAFREEARRQNDCWSNVNVAKEKLLVLKLTKDRMMGVYPFRLPKHVSTIFDIVRINGSHNTPVFRPERVVRRIIKRQRELGLI